MFHIIFSIASGFLHLGNILQGFSRGILALRYLHTIVPSHLIPTISPPPTAPLLDAPSTFVGLPQIITPPYSSSDLILIGRSSPVFVSSTPSYQSSLIVITPNQLPDLVPLVMVLAIISGVVVFLPEIVYFSTKLANIISTFTNTSTGFARCLRLKPISNLIPAGHLSQATISLSFISLLLSWTGPPAITSVFTFIWIVSILFSYEESSNAVVTILQRCGLMAVRDTQTPPILNALYEQITCWEKGYDNLVAQVDVPDECSDHNSQLTTVSCLGYSHLASQLREQERDLRDARMKREKQEREKVTAKRWLRTRHSYAESADSQNNIRQQLQPAHSRQQELSANLLAAERERDRLKTLVSTLEASNKKRRGWKEMAESAEARCTVAEMTAFNLRAELRAAIARTQNTQEQLDYQTEVASSQDGFIQSITEESRMLQTKLNGAEDEIARLDAELRHEHDRRLREMNELRDEQARIQVRHESEVFRLVQEARTAQEQLEALRDELSQLRADGRPQLFHVPPPDYHPPSIKPADTGQPPLLPERILDIGTPPVNSVFGPNSSLRPAESQGYLHRQDRDGASASQAASFHQICGSFDQVSDVAKSQRAALEELLERMRQLESGSTSDENSNHHDEKHPQFELAATKKQLRLTEGELVDVRRDLDQSREALQELETYAKDMIYEPDMCLVKLRDAQDARRALVMNLDEAVELLRLRSAMLESSLSEAEASQFACSQITLLSTALQERVNELEDEVKKLKSRPKHSTTPTVHRDSTSSCTADSAITSNNADLQVVDSLYMTVPSSLSRLLDLSLPPALSEFCHSSLYLCQRDGSTIVPACVNSGLFLSANTAITHDADSASCVIESKICESDSQILDSIYMTLPTSMPYLLDVSLPPSSSQSSDVDMRIYEASPCTTVGLHDMNEETTDLCATCPVPASSSSKRSSLPPSGFPRTFLSERGGVDPVDWPPIGSIPLCSDRNVRQYDGVVVQTKENTDILIVLQNTRPTPARELNENRPNYASHTSYNSPDRSLAQTPDQRLASFDKHPSALPFPEPCNKSPVITTFFSSFLAPPTSERRVNIEGRDSSQQGCDDITSISTRLDPRVELPQQPRLRELELPPFPSLPPFSLSPSTFLQSLRRHTASFLARISSSSSVTGDTPPHSLYNDLSSSIQSRERHLTGDGLVAPLDGIRSTTTPAVTGFSVRNQDDLQAVPPQREFSLPFNNTAGFGGAMSSWNSSSNFSLPAHPLLGCLEGFTWGLDSLEVGRPSGLFSVLSEQRGPVLKRDSISTAIPSPLEARGEPPVISDPLEPLLGSKISRYNIDELSRVPSPGSRPSHIAADLQKRDTWMQSCLPVSLGQSCDVALIQSDLVPTASSSPSNHLFAPGPAAIGPLKWDGREANSSVPVVSFRWEDTEARVLNTKRITKSSLRAPLPRLLPGLLDPDYKEWAHHIDESPCASERPPKGRRANQYRVISRPRDIRKLDYGLPEDLVPSSGVFSLKRLDPDLDVSACIIPSDCPTSTPVASRKQTGGGSHACVERPDSQGSMASRKMKEQALLPGETVYPPDPIFDFFGI